MAKEGDHCKKTKRLSTMISLTSCFNPMINLLFNRSLKLARCFRCVDRAIPMSVKKTVTVRQTFFKLSSTNLQYSKISNCAISVRTVIYTGEQIIKEYEAVPVG